jgi:hypothetical protein
MRQQTIYILQLGWAVCNMQKSCRKIISGERMPERTVNLGESDSEESESSSEDVCVIYSVFRVRN